VWSIELGGLPIESVALALAAVHFGVPLLYYLYLKWRWLSKPWDVSADPSYRPRVSVVVPTYNEAGFIEVKLDNIYGQVYPRDRLEVIVVDSASSDGTPGIVRRWAERHPDLRLVLVEEPVRRGKAYALNTALRHASGEVVVVTDADSLWPSRSTLSEAVKWLSDPAVGAVSCIKQPASPGFAGVEESYRGYYSVVRVAESKAWSTPVFHGELAAFKRELLERLGGFPVDIGADDSYIATRIALMGYRAITPGDVRCVEVVPGKGYHMWRVRRAQHLIQHFAKTLREGVGTPERFKPILYTEAFLHLVNPWILVAATLLLAASAIMGSIAAAILLALGAASLLYKPYRAWVASQAYLVVAAVRNLWTKEIAWEKQSKTGQAQLNIRSAADPP